MSKLRICAIVLALAVVGATTAHAKMVLKAGHVLTAKSDQGRGADFLAKRVKELTNGEIEIQVFPDGQLECCLATSAKSAPSRISWRTRTAVSPAAAESAAVGVLPSTTTLTEALAGTANSSWWS